MEQAEALVVAREQAAAAVQGNTPGAKSGTWVSHGSSLADVSELQAAFAPSAVGSGAGVAPASSVVSKSGNKYFSCVRALYKRKWLPLK